MNDTAEISRANPALFLLLIDQSASMADPIGSGEGEKQAVLADVVNKLLQNLCIKCNKQAGILDYFHVGVLGYGGDAVTPALGGALAGREVVTVSEIAYGNSRYEDRTKFTVDEDGEKVETLVTIPIWLDPKSDGGTPMAKALDAAHRIVTQWVVDHPHSFPPIVLNITDGEANGGDPVPAADRVRAVACADGNALLFNLHLSSSSVKALHYVSNESTLPDQHTRQLYAMSSVLPPPFAEVARSLDYVIAPGARAFVVNAGLVELIQFVEIGTRPANLR